MISGYQKMLGFGMIGVGLLCLLTWGLNALGWIRMGSSIGQLIMAPVCFSIALMILRPRIQRH
jgi:hypothetical protein